MSTLFQIRQIKKAPRLALPFFIFLAGLLHFSTIYLFKIIYQPSHVIKPVPAQVLFLLPNSTLSQQLSCWLKSNDPSIFSPLKTVQSTWTPPPTSIYDPGSVAVPLRHLPDRQKISNDFLPPVDEPVLPPLLSYSHISSSIAPKPIQQTTTVQLLGSLSTRVTASPLSVPSLPPEITSALPPTKLTLNIDTTGIPRHVIISQSCGNSAADEAASRWAMTLRFAPADQETWGPLLVIWGASEKVTSKE